MPDSEEKLYPVWDHNGQLHYVTELNKHDLVRHMQWNTLKPIVVNADGKLVEPVVPAPDPSPNAPPVVPAPVQETLLPQSPKIANLDTSNAAQDLNSMSREGLVRFAKEKFNMEFDANVSHEQILNGILAEIEA